MLDKLVSQVHVVVDYILESERDNYLEQCEEHHTDPDNYPANTFHVYANAMLVKIMLIKIMIDRIEG